MSKLCTSLWSIMLVPLERSFSCFSGANHRAFIEAKFWPKESPEEWMTSLCICDFWMTSCIVHCLSLSYIPLLQLNQLPLQLYFIKHPNCFKQAGKLTANHKVTNAPTRCNAMPVSSLPFTGKMAVSRADGFVQWFPVVKSSWVGIQWFTEVDLGIVNQYISHHLCNTVTYNVNVLCKNSLNNAWPNGFAGLFLLSHLAATNQGAQKKKKREVRCVYIYIYMWMYIIVYPSAGCFYTDTSDIIHATWIELVLQIVHASYAWEITITETSQLNQELNMRTELWKEEKKTNRCKKHVQMYRFDHYPNYIMILYVRSTHICWIPYYQ